MPRSTRLLPLFVGALLLTASHAVAQDPGTGPTPVHARVARAEQLAEAAFEAYQQQEYQRAIELYQSAWSAAPSADIAFNIARVYDRGLHDARSATDYYQRYVADPKAQPQRRRNAELRIAELKAELDASRRRDSELAERSAPAATPPPATVAGALAAPPAPPASAPAVSSNPWTPREVTALILGGVGVTALGVGLGFALSASGERSEWERGCDGNACTSQAAVNAARSAGRKADIATVALAAGGGLLAIGATLWWFGPTAGEGGPRAELRLSPSGQAMDLTCTLSGHF